MTPVSQDRIIILPARNCRRSRKIIEYLEEEEISFTRIELESTEGLALAEKHQMRASPGVLVNGVSVNPFDLLIQGECRVDKETARRVLGDRPSAEGSG
jgi:glutaredoxin